MMDAVIEDAMSSGVLTVPGDSDDEDCFGCWECTWHFDSIEGFNVEVNIENSLGDVFIEIQLDQERKFSLVLRCG